MSLLGLILIILLVLFLFGGRRGSAAATATAMAMEGWACSRHPRHSAHPCAARHV